jgi:uncharacterized membrane protein
VLLDISTGIAIDCPVDKVSGFAANLDNATQWYGNVKSAEWRSSKTLAVGSQIAFHTEFRGRMLTSVYQIVKYMPGQILVMATADGPFPMQTTLSWKAVNANSTQMTLRNRGIPTGLSALLSPFLAISMKRANKKDLKKLKEILERTR